MNLLMEGIRTFDLQFSSNCVYYALTDNLGNIVSDVQNLSTGSMARNDSGVDSVDRVFRLQDVPVDFDITVSGTAKTVAQLRAYDGDPAGSGAAMIVGEFDSETVFNVSGTFQVQSYYVSF